MEFPQGRNYGEVQIVKALQSMNKLVVLHSGLMYVNFINPTLQAILIRGLPFTI
jgi:hypothetical protein